MNKKLIKVLAITSCALGGGLSISSFSTSCSKSSSTGPLPSDIVCLPENVTQQIFSCNTEGQLTGFNDGYADIIAQYPEVNTIKLPSKINDIDIISLGTTALYNATLNTISTLIVPKTILYCQKYACLQTDKWANRIIFESDQTQISGFLGNPPHSITTEIYYPGNSPEQIAKSLASGVFTNVGVDAPASAIKKVISTGKMSSEELRNLFCEQYGLSTEFTWE